MALSAQPMKVNMMASKRSPSAKSKSSPAASSLSTGQASPVISTFASLPQVSLLPMELGELTLSRAGFPAKIFQGQASRPDLARERVADCGAKSSDLLASYDRASSSWRTSQTCFLALLANQGDGLAEFSATWPSAGMMRNGKTYRRQPWALPIAESAYGLWPTPTKVEIEETWEKWSEREKYHAAKGVNLHFKLNVAAKLWPTPTKRDSKGSRKPEALAASGRGATNSLGDALTIAGQHGQLNPTWVEWLMGYPIGHTELPG